VPPHRPDGRNVTVELLDAANIRDIKPLSDLAFGLRPHPSAFIGDSIHMGSRLVTAPERLSQWAAGPRLAWGPRSSASPPILSIAAKDWGD
jgi:hypothetical protein